MNQRKRCVLIIFVIMFINLSVFTDLFAQVEFHGFVRNHSAFRVDKPNDAMLLRNRLRLNSELWGDNVYAFASFDILNDVADSAINILNLREAYLDIYSSFVDFRIGKQQVVWGKADGYFINDIVNPLDLSYFLLQDFDDIRMATTMLNTKLYFGNHSLEVLVIPEFKLTKISFKGDWGFERPDSIDILIDPINSIIVSLPLSYQQDKIQEKSIRKAEYGFKFNTFLLGTDLSIIYLKVREDKLIYLKQIVADNYGLHNGVNLTPSHPWVTFYGANFSRPFGTSVFRGEGGYYTKRLFDTEGVKYINEGMLVEKGFVQGMLGIDYQLTGDIDIGVQAIHERILDYEDGIVNDDANSIGTFLIRGRFFNETVLPMILTLYNIDNKSSLSRIMVDWNYSDSFIITFGIDILEGDSDTIFGQFNRNDNVYLKVKYSF
ncbi:MAG: hypothetical protein ISS81_03885 [Candidatus Marinimicrobia bacterium]|nr:hypothetical protein [Candidatus Neomarinimicrobiota bacterium]